MGIRQKSGFQKKKKLHHSKKHVFGFRKSDIFRTVFERRFGKAEKPTRIKTPPLVDPNRLPPKTDIHDTGKGSGTYADVRRMLGVEEQLISYINNNAEKKY